MLDSKYVNTIYKTLLSKEYIDCIWNEFSRTFYKEEYFIFYMNVRYDIGSGFGLEKDICSMIMMRKLRTYVFNIQIKFHIELQNWLRV